jgi:hypothetical protein
MAENEADTDRTGMDTGGGQEQGEADVETGVDGGSGGGRGGGDAEGGGDEEGQESGLAKEDFVREPRSDLLPVGRVIAQKFDGCTSNSSAKLRLSIVTFLTDLYRIPHWWLKRT